MQTRRYEKWQMILFLRGKMEVENEKEMKEIAKKRQRGTDHGGKKKQKKKNEVIFLFFFSSYLF